VTGSISGCNITHRRHMLRKRWNKYWSTRTSTAWFTQQTGMPASSLAFVLAPL